MRLIDADSLIKNFRLLINRSYLGEISAHTDISIGSVAGLIKDEPTAFDLESVIEQIEEKRDYYYSEIKNTGGCCVDIFNEYHNKGIAFNEALEIIKSAANATNGKKGGRWNDI